MSGAQALTVPEAAGFGIGKMLHPPVTQFALALRDALGICEFVETGTYHGQSALWAAQHFERVTSVEIDINHYQMARRNSDGYRNLSLLYGDSRNVLPTVVAKLRAPALFFLDAHNFNNAFITGQDDCPVLDELKAIFSTPLQHAVLIDDAANFTTRPSKVFPVIEALLAFAMGRDYLHGVAHDVLAFVPPTAAPLLTAFVAG